MPRLTSPSARYRESATLIKQAAGSRVAGVWTPGAETSTAITVESAPPSGARVRDIQPDGARLQDWRMFWIYTDVEPLRVGTGQTDGDVVLYDGIRYRVRHTADYRPHGPVEVLGVRPDPS